MGKRVKDETLHEFVARYPKDHAHAGAIVGRKATCSRCSGQFKQYKVNPEWLDALRPGARAAFLRACEVDRGGAAFQPARCPRCERSALKPGELNRIAGDL